MRTVPLERETENASGSSNSMPSHTVCYFYTSWLQRYKYLAELLHKFFISIRDGYGAVTRQLLEAFITTLPPELKDEFVAAKTQRHDRFFRRWRRDYNIVDRRISGPKIFSSWF